jgi:type IV secretory pathway VirB4 component
MYTVVDISELGDDLLAVGMFIATTFSNQIINANRTKTKAIIFDEAWRVLNSKIDKGGEIVKHVQQIAKIIRGLAGAAIFATQDLNDLLENEQAASIVTQCDSKMIMGLKESEARLARKTLGLSADEEKMITRFKKGNGVLVVGNDHIKIKVVASNKEAKLISTDKETLRQVEAEEQAAAV